MHALDEKLTQYQQQGTQFRVAHETTEKLDPGLYRINADMHGVFFEQATMTNDDILDAQDERLDGIIEEASSFWALKERYAELGLTHKRGILLESAPGTGKSVLMQRLAEDAIKQGAIVFTSTDPGLLKEGLHQIRAVETDRNIMVLMDDFDRHFSYAEGKLITLLDGEDSISNVLFVAATNYVERMSARLRRPGRFDTQVTVENPPESVREAYFKHKLPEADDKKIKTLVKATEDFSFAEMKEIIVSTEIYDRDISTEATRIKSVTRTKAEAADEAQKVKMIRHGKVVKGLPPKKGFKIVGNKYVRMTGVEKNIRKKAGIKAGKKGKAARSRAQKLSQKLRARRGM